MYKSGDSRIAFQIAVVVWLLLADYVCYEAGLVGPLIVAVRDMSTLVRLDGLRSAADTQNWVR